MLLSKSANTQSNGAKPGVSGGSEVSYFSWDLFEEESEKESLEQQKKQSKKVTGRMSKRYNKKEKNENM